MHFLGNVEEGFKLAVEILPNQAVIFNEPERLGSVVDRAGLGFPPLESGDAGMIVLNLFDVFCFLKFVSSQDFYCSSQLTLQSFNS